MSSLTRTACPPACARTDKAPIYREQPCADNVLQIEIWKVKKLIKRLEAARGNGTSMISLIIRMFIAHRNALKPLESSNAHAD